MLPNGFYACCMNTLLDESESALVRENAAFVFASLISHRNPNGTLNDRVLPSRVSRVGDDWFDMLLKHHGFFNKVMASIKYLYLEEFISLDKLKNATKLVPCNLMRSYCVILSHLLHVQTVNGKENVIMAMLQIYKIIPDISQTINKSSALLLVEICDLIAQCIIQNKALIDQISSEYQIVQALISFLNIKSFGEYSSLLLC